MMEEIVFGGSEPEEKEKGKRKKTELTPEQKRRRRRRIRRIAIILLILLIVGWQVRARLIAANAPVTVETAAAVRGDIDQVLSTSGEIGTQERRTWFSGVAVPVQTVSVKVGDTVKAGDVLLTYDTEEIELQKKQAKLNAQEADGNYSGAIQKDNRTVSKKNVADAELPVVEEQIATIRAQRSELQTQIDQLNHMIEEKKTRIQRTQTDLQKLLSDLNQNGIPDTEDEDPLTDKQKEMEQEVQDELKEITYALENDEELLSWKRQAEELQRVMSDLSEARTEDLDTKKSELKADQSTGESSALTGGEKSALSAQKQKAELSAEDTIASLDEAAEGVKAGFDGVVTSVSVKEGATPAVGGELLTVESTEQVKVTVNATKYDLEKLSYGQDAEVSIGGRTYEAVVDEISRNATKNAQNVSVIAVGVKIKNPDDQIFLGMEADVKIHTASAKDTLLVPVEAVNADSRGNFVYALEDGVIVRKDVETGISSDTMQEILNGLQEGDQVLVNITGNIEEGMPAVSVTE